MAELTGFYYCQLISIILLFSIVLYRFVTYYFYERNEIIENILVFLSACLFGSWLIIRAKYTFCYRKDISYPKNEEGIWLPFRFIVSQPYSLSGLLRTDTSHFCKDYYMGYTEMKEHIKDTTIQKGYHVIAEYNENEREVIFLVVKQRILYEFLK